jgi:hypothetical protein
MQNGRVSYLATENQTQGTVVEVHRQRLEAGLLMFEERRGDNIRAFWVDKWVEMARLSDEA